MYRPRAEPLNPDSPAARAATAALADALADIRRAVMARKRAAAVQVEGRRTQDAEAA